MFKKLKRKIKTSFLLISAIFVGLVSIFTFITITNYQIKDFYNQSKTKVHYALSNYNFHLNSLTANAHLLGNDSNIQAYLNSNDRKGDTLSALNDFQRTNITIKGVTLYAFTNEYISSSNMSNVPSLNQIIDSRCFQSLINTDRTELITIRNTAIAKYFDNEEYNVNLGILSLGIKIKSTDNKDIGYLIIDFDTVTIYNEFFSYNDFSKSIIIANGLALKTSEQLFYDKYIEFDSKNEGNINEFIYRTTLNNNIEIITILSKASVNNEILLTIILIIAADLILILFAILMINRLNKYVEKPLTNISIKIKKQSSSLID